MRTLKDDDVADGSLSDPYASVKAAEADKSLPKATKKAASAGTLSKPWTSRYWKTSLLMSSSKRSNSSLATSTSATVITTANNEHPFTDNNVAQEHFELCIDIIIIIIDLNIDLNIDLHRLLPY